jgi:glycosyltransferase involved in cell wall biosynthesis
MNKKKILFISQYFYPENFKGNDLVFELINRGFEVLVITGKPNYPEGYFYKGYGLFKRNLEEINGAKVYRLPLIPRGKGGMIRIVLNYFSFYFSSWIFYFFSPLKFDYDLIITQQLSPLTSSLPAIWYKKKKNRPLITWVLDLWPESIISTTTIKSGLIVDLIEKAALKLYNSSDIILVSSKSFIKPISERFISKDKIIHFPNWADEIFESSLIQKDFTLLPSGFNVVFAGNFGVAQDFNNVINAIKLISPELNINFIFVGSGRYEKELKLQVVKNNLKNVYIFPQHSVEYMPSLYTKASAMLLTLKGGEYISNTVPAKLQTYLSSSKAVIAMIDGEASDIINESKCGFVAPAGDYKSLAKNIIKMKQLPSFELQQLEKNAFDYYRLKYSRKVAMNKVQKIIDQLI